MRAPLATLLLALGWPFLSACASGGGGKGATGPTQPEHVAPAPPSGETEGAEAVGTGAGSPEHAPEIVHTGKSFHLGFAAARDRYASKGVKCGGADAPETVIGQPDNRNETQVGHDKLVTYGFRFSEGTLVIRCRNDHVEASKTLGAKR